MEKEQLLRELDERLKGLPEEDREKLIELYEDLINVAEENRKNKRSYIETAAIEEEFQVPIEIENKGPNLGRTILASISLFLFNSIFVLGPTIAIACIYFALWIVAVCFVFSPILVVTQFVTIGFNSMELFLSILLCGIGVFIGVGNRYMGKGLYKTLKNYINWNIKLIKGE